MYHCRLHMMICRATPLYIQNVCQWCLLHVMSGIKGSPCSLDCSIDLVVVSVVCPSQDEVNNSPEPENNKYEDRSPYDDVVRSGSRKNEYVHQLLVTL